MIRIVLFFLLVFGLAFGFSLMADSPGNLEINWLGYQFQTSMMVAMVVLVTIVTVIMVSWWLISSILHSPQIFSRWRRGRRRDRGYDALSKGLIAAGAGDAITARKLTRDSSKLLESEPLVALLDAQTALLEGKRDVARSRFESMLEEPETRMLGLRGLFVEAERHGDQAAAGHFAKKAFEIAPAANWAGQAMLRNQGLTTNWQGALQTLEAVKSAGGISTDEASRKKAVLLTARAMEEEDSNPDDARSWALAAHKLDPSLVPASVIAARLLGRAGDLRKAAKVLETSWKIEPHPEIAETYVHLRSGDSTLDRLKRAKSLANLRGNHIEGQIAIAHAAIDAQDWKEARQAMESVLRNSPTERACLLMADIEEAEFGDRGRVRDWLARALRAPRDAAWTADGQVSDQWAAISPITGELDAFEWRIPVLQLGDAGAPTDYSEFAHMPAPPPLNPPAATIAASTTLTADGVKPDDETTDIPAPAIDGNSDDVEDAEIIEDTANIEPVKEPQKASDTPQPAAPLVVSEAPEAVEETQSNVIDLEAAASAKKSRAAPEEKSVKSEDGETVGTKEPTPEKELSAQEAVEAGSSKAKVTSTKAGKPDGKTKLRDAEKDSMNPENIDDAVARMMEHRPDDPGVPEEDPDEDKKRFRLF